MWVIVLIIIGVVGLCYDILQQLKAYQWEQETKEFTKYKINFLIDKQVNHDLIQDWHDHLYKHTPSKFIPKEYIEYFELNHDAYSAWEIGKVREIVLSLGYHPRTMAALYAYDPHAPRGHRVTSLMTKSHLYNTFDYKYKDLVNHFNETGEYFRTKEEMNSNKLTKDFIIQGGHK